MEAALSERSDARRNLGPLGFPPSSCEGRATKCPLDLVAGGLGLWVFPRFHQAR